jgi:hypothetical protein
MKPADVRSCYLRYERLEDRFVEISRFLPLVPDLSSPNYKVASPELADFGVSCLTWFEGLLRALASEERFKGAEGVEEARNIRKMQDAWVFCIKTLQWGNKGWPLLDTTEPIIRPFEDWKESSSPNWFRSYSGPKHRPLEMARTFTLKDALYSFVALYIVIHEWQSPAFYEPRFSRILQEYESQPI